MGSDERVEGSLPEEEEAVSEAQEFVGRIQELSEAFDALCSERHTAGQEEYGKLTFLENDVTRMMIEELADTANYCRYQAIKLMLLQDFLEQKVTEEFGDGTEEITLGVKAFKGVSEVGWQGTGGKN